MQFAPLTLLTDLAVAWWSWPLQWARGPLKTPRFAPLRPLTSVRAIARGLAPDLAAAAGGWQASQVAAALDAIRSLHAAAVQAGAIERSLIASGAFERSLARMETLALGSRARRV